MKTGSSGRLPGFMALVMITVFSGLALGGTFTLTEDKIREQAEIAADNARRTVMPQADDFRIMNESDGLIDWCYEALEADGAVGYVAQTTVNGFGGPIEIIAGVDNEGRITGVSVGGSNFAETPGLGANAKNKSFTDEFIGKHGGISAVKAGKVRGENDIDAMTSATITSSAVADGVNIICSYVENIGSASQEASAPAQSSETENTENGEGGAV